MEKSGLMESFANPLARMPRIILLFFSLIALVCLPMALSGLVRDASIGLLFPLTLLSALLAWGLAQWHVRGISSGIILLFLGPLALFVRIGQMGKAISDLVQQTFVFILSLTSVLSQQNSVDPSSFVSASHDLTDKILTLGSRILVWTAGFWQGTYVEDPLIRTFAWSLFIWLIAAWAGWQIFRNKRLLVGMIPTTIIIALVLDYTGKEIWIFWLHVSLLVFLYGLNGFVTLQKHWEISRVDYSDSAQFETLLMVSALTLGLVIISALASKVSIKDILDDFREKQTSSNEARTESLGIDAGGSAAAVSGISSDLLAPHKIGPGPELSDQLVMTVSTGDLPPMPLVAHPTVQNYYWRTMTYERYTGSGWNNPAPIVEDIPTHKILIEPPYQNYRVIHQEITFPNGADEHLYWTGTLISAEIPFRALWIRKAAKDPLLESDMLAALASAKTYRVDSLLPDVTVEDLRHSPSVYPDWVRNRFLGLPDSVPERVRALGRDLSASGKTPFDRALIIQNYLREFPYSLDVPAPLRHDAADYFLFDLKKGYCDYYATTMVVLARAAGLPARLVIGYTSGSYDSEQARYIVTEENAHAWVEIYFTNIGWVEFEPTPNQPAITYSEDGVLQAPAQALEPPAFFTNQFALRLKHALGAAWIPAIVILFSILLIWTAWDAMRLTRLEPSGAIQLLYRRLRRIARPMSGSISRGQTAHEYASLLKTKVSALERGSRFHSWLSPAMDEITQLTEVFARSIFAPQSPSRAEARDAMHVWSHLQWRLLFADAIAIKNRWLHLFRKRED